MGFGSWLTNAIDVVTPWDRGGELERRKKREEEEARQRWQQSQSRSFANNSNQSNNQLRVTNNRSDARVSVEGYEPEPQKPKNIFEDLNKNLNFNKPNNTRNPLSDIGKVKVVEQPKPGAVVKPKLRVDNRENRRPIRLPNGQISTGELTPEQQAKRILERELNAGKSWEDIARDNNFDYEAVKQYSQATRPNYGINVERPNQGLGDRFRDIFDANTQADQWRRQQGNLEPGADQKDIVLKNPGNIVGQTPIVGHITKMVNTGYQQTNQIAATLNNYLASKEVNAAYESGDPIRIERALRRLEYTQAEQDSANARFEKNKGGFLNTGTLYDSEAAATGDAESALMDIVLPTAVAGLDLYTLGKGNLITQGIRNNGFKNTVRLPSSSMYKAGVGRVPVAGRGDVAKLVAGNYASGDLDVRSKGGTNAQAVQGGLLNSLIGSVPDIALPEIANIFRNKITPKILRRNKVNPADVVDEIDDAAIGASATALTEDLTPKPIPVRQVTDIPVKAPDVPGQAVNVRNLNTPGELIQDVSGGERFATPNNLVKQNATDTKNQAIRDAAFDQKKTAPKPNPAIEGITPRKFSDIAGVSKKELAQERKALDDALANGEITKTQYAAANKELDNIYSSVDDAVGREPTYRIDRGRVVETQSKIIDDYAKQLRELGEGNGVNMVRQADGTYTRVTNNVRPKDFKGKRVTKAMWREEAERQLRSGKAEPGAQKAFNDAADPEVQSLLDEANQPKTGKGRPIEVKQVQGIDVKDQNKVPVNTPETPGKVRVTTSSEPVKVKSEAAANTPTAKAPADLPAKTQEILDNPKRFTKRQVAAARNQRKLARQMAKAQEETSEAMERINTASPARQSEEGFVPTGKFKKGKNGNIYEKSSKVEEMSQGVKETSQMSPEDVIQTARNNKIKNGVYTPRDIRNVEAIIETRRVKRGTPEFIEMQKILKESGSDWGKTGALRKGTKMRRSASANELISRYETKIYSLADDPTKIDSKLFDKIDAAETAFVEARDAAKDAYNRYMANPTSNNDKAFHSAQDLADKADIEAKQTEYLVAKQALKGNKDVKQTRAIQKLATEADLGKMDYVDSAMLSGTAMLRNFVNSLPGAAEEAIFGKGAAKIAGKMTGQTIGGGFGRGTLKDLGKSIKGFSNKAKVMKKDSGNIFRHPIENMKTWSTLGNELGDTVIDTNARQSLGSYYRKVLKEQGYSGKELTDRLSIMNRMDPEDMLPTYQTLARVDAGLSGGNIAKRSKLELQVANGISDIISAGKPSAKTDAIAKALTRVTVGFPSAVARATATGVKRLGPGPLFDFAKAIRETDPTKKALLTKQAIKQGASSATIIPGLFYTLGQAGLLSGSYPTGDKEEQARWEREGISENSIKIGNSWYQYPAFLGAWSVPAMFWGNMGRTDGDFVASAKDMAKGISDVVPTDQLSRIKDVIDGRYDPGKFAATMAANTTRALTPYGALLGQVAKAFDPTKNDTNSRGVLDNFVDKVFSGIPGGNKLRDIPDKVDDAGNPIKNPGVIQTMTGATSAVQGKGEERTAQIQSEVDSALKSISDTGALKDTNFREILDDETALVYDKAAKGEQLKESELEDLQSSLIKGVSQEGGDTAYLEREQYDTHLAALKLKKQSMEADKTIAPSKLEKIETAIKRGEVYRDNKIPYDMISDYQDIGVEDWRKMGDPEDDEYDPDMYQKLWDIDQLMTKNGVSYKKGSLDENKYYLKKKKSGSGSGRGGKASIKSFSGDFGKLKGGKYAPQVKAYETIESKSGGIPRIRVQRPNIVHKISASR